VHDQPVFVPTEIKDDAIVAYEINRRPELSLYIRRPTPLRASCCREAQADRPFSRRVTPPKLFKSSKGDHLHKVRLSCHQNGDKRFLRSKC
jgi:hypothetical protein